MYQSSGRGTSVLVRARHLMSSIFNGENGKCAPNIALAANVREADGDVRASSGLRTAKRGAASSAVVAVSTASAERRMATVEGATTRREARRAGLGLGAACVCGRGGVTPQDNLSVRSYQ